MDIREKRKRVIKKLSLEIAAHQRERERERERE